MKKMKRISFYLEIIILVMIDQITKLAVINCMSDKTVTIIKGILNFSYCENKGIAFSIGNGHVPIFIIINMILISSLIFYYEKNRFELKGISKMFFTMVIAGGISNLIDRITRGFVVDFIDINELLDFAIFNVADIYIVIGVIGIALKYIIPGTKKDDKKEI